MDFAITIVLAAIAIVVGCGALIAALFKLFF